jgi:aminoacyl-tRNA hydrolase
MPISRIGGTVEYAAKVIRRAFLYPLAWINRRLKHRTVFVGITGSAGKTTSKDLCVAVLSSFMPCASTWESSNGRFEVAQTVRRVRRRHRVCVVEVSAARPGQLDFSLGIVKPDIAVLTLVARDHFSAFKSIEAIAEEKAKVVAALPPTGVAVLNIDDPLVKKVGEACNRRVVWIGQAEGATLRLLKARSSWPEPLTLAVQYQGAVHQVETQLHGTQLALSVLVALGVAVALDLPIERAIAALKGAKTTEGRMQVVAADDGVTFVRDDWKAPLWSLQAPFDFMKQATAPRKVMIIGTLSDYSMSASKIYPKVATQALEVGDLVVFVGPHAMRALKAGSSRDDKQLLAFPSIREASAYLKEALREGDLVLMKGSNKADHLVRLMLDRKTPIHCWQQKCGLSAFCGSCGNLFKGPPPPAMEVSQPATRQNPELAQLKGQIIRADGTQAPRIIVGLGNPGQQFVDTPHNVGYRVLDTIARSTHGSWQEHPEGLVSFTSLEGVPVALLKPGASMNRSGEQVRRFIDRLGGQASRCIVVHDDMDLLLGDVRVKRNGGDAGHKGVQSVIAALGSGAFERVRIGVRREGDARRAREMVLADFTAAEAPTVGKSIDTAAATVIQRSLERASSDSAQTLLGL